MPLDHYLFNGQAIQARGQAVFRDLFESYSDGIRGLLLWKSAVVLRNDEMRIPCLSIYEIVEGVVDNYGIRWVSSNDNVQNDYLTLWFK